jgi:DNA invertase Pin-like site-specific DNA recombinase
MPQDRRSYPGPYPDIPPSGGRDPAEIRRLLDFVSYDNNLDTSTPTGKLVFQIVGAVAEFEKDIIKEGVIADLANARRKGKRLGRPPVSEELYEKAKQLRRKGLSFRKIGLELGIDEGTIRKRMKLDLKVRI